MTLFIARTPSDNAASHYELKSCSSFKSCLFFGEGKREEEEEREQPREGGLGTK